MQKLDKIIEKASFSKREAEIISVIYKNGHANILSLSKDIGLARPSIYSAVKDLTARRVLSKKKKGKRIVFVINKDFDIRSLYQETSKQISESLNLPVKKNSDSGLMPYFKDLNGFLDLALKLKRGEVIYSIETPEDIDVLLKNTEKEWLKHWQETVARKGIVLKGISSPTGLDIFKKSLGNLSEILKKRSGSARFISDIKIQTSIVSFKDYICFFNRRNKKFVVIKDETIATTMQSIIDFIYNISEYKNLFP
ncbi:MAG: hypothetical protein WC631_03225 [Candidatus Paceibacterota bacterium]|jgi:hypothetical protein